MIEERGIDRFDKKEQKARKESEHYIDVDTAEHTDARNVGAEWLCKQTIDKLKLEEFLHNQGWSNHSIHTALSALIVRTVYAVSERSSYHYLHYNSAAAELYSGSKDWLPGINSLYKVTDKLYALKEEIELNVFYLLLIVGILLVLQHCFEIRHALFHIVSKHLVQAKMLGFVELFEEVGHEVLQESISAIEFKEVALIGFFGRGCLEFPLFIDV